jgi:putative transposase
MRAPVLVVADGAAGIWKAARELWRVAKRQRCTVHALRNVTSKLPERHHVEVKARYWQVLDDTGSVGEAKAGLLAIAADYERSYSSAARVITDNIDQLVAHLRFPLVHRKRTRSTNLVERTFVEVRRSTRVIGRFPGETSALSLIWAVLEPSSRGWRGVEMTEDRRRDRTHPPTRSDRGPRHRPVTRGGARRLTSTHSGGTPGLPERRRPCLSSAQLRNRY